MINNKIRLLALLLSLMLIFTASGCKDKDTTAESEEVEIEYVYEDELPESSNGQTSSKEDKTDSENSGSNTGSSQTNSSSDKVNSAASSGNKPNNNSGNKTVNNGVNPDDYKNTKVVYATWRDPKLYEDGPVVKAFEKKYGITVQADLIPENEYTNTIIGRIAAGNSPDVYFCTYSFPYCLQALQPIDAAKLNLKESIWDQTIINLSTVNGKTYLVNTSGNIWNDQDMVFYNKKLMEDNNITTPADYIKSGKWTFDAMKKCMQDVAALGTKYVGGAINVEGLINGTGASFIKFQNGKFINGTNTLLTNVCRWVAEGVKEGYIKGLYTTDTLAFKNGNYGLVVGHAFGLKANGYWRDMNPDHIGFAPIPAWDAKTKAVPSTFVRGWGICTGAKNPVGAGIFLRYYLDVDNYNTSKAFLNAEAETFFFKLTSDNTPKNYYFLYGTGTEGVTGTSRGVYLSAVNQDPSQVAVKIQSVQNTLNSDIQKLNKMLSSKKK